MSRTGSLTLLVISLLAAWLGYAIGERGHSSERAVPAVVARTAPQNAIAANGPRTSIAARYADLARRADAGDGAAAIELARALGHCAEVDPLQRSLLMSQMQSNDARFAVKYDDNNRDAVRRFQQRLSDSLRESGAGCEGITRAQQKSYGRWLYKAAEAGDAASAFEFGSGRFLFDDTLGNLEEVSFWRDHAEDMLQRALAGGDGHALFTLAEAYDPASMPRWTEGPIFDADPVKAYAYYLAGSERNRSIGTGVEPRLERLESSLSDADRAAAQQLAAEICATGVCTPPQRH
ncbi:MAG TPA: hypothetical protein VFV97_17385 [Rhodanobacteraceae bacterium]|nr:hypothetical protein [Rhodanobacteraceae bacterium]